jgi:hypothetical protein
LSKLTDLIVGGTANIGDVVIEGVIRVKLDTKITCMRIGSNGCAAEGKRRVDYLASLLRGANEKIFSL